MIIRKKNLFAFVILFLLVGSLIPAEVVAQFSGSYGSSGSSGSYVGSGGFGGSSSFGSSGSYSGSGSFSGSSGLGGSSNFGSSNNYGSSGRFSSFSSTSSASYVTRQPRPTLQTLYGSDMNTYWPILGDRATCDARSDLLLSVAPAGCSPIIVRSDLLAEQNVPVFCQIDSFKINPLVDVAQIRGIRFTGKYPDEVAGVGFHPARAALRSQERLLSAPLLNNIGYAVIVLKRQPDESKLPDNVNLTLSAAIDYNAGNSLGIGRTEFILEQVTDSQWESEKFKQSFWNGRYFLRLEEADANFATVSIYQGDRRAITTRVERGKTSRDIYLPGMFCRAGLQIDYDGFVSADTRAKIEVNTDGAVDVFEVTEGSRFANSCVVNKIYANQNRETGSVLIYCGGRNIELKLGNKYLGVSGNNITIDGIDYKVSESNGELRVSFGSSVSFARRGVYVLDRDGRLFRGNEGVVVDANGVARLSFSESDKEWLVNLWRNLKSYGNSGAGSDNFKIDRTSEQWKYFDDAIKDYETVAKDFPLEKRNSLEGTPTFGEDALIRGIALAKEFGADDVQQRLINEFRQLYPDDSRVEGYINELNSLGRLDFSEASQAVEFDGRTRVIRLVGLTEPIDKPRATLDVDGTNFEARLRERVALPSFNGEKRGEIILEGITPREVSLSAYCRNEFGVVSTRREIYNLALDGYSKNICGSDVRLVRTNSKEIAKIRLSPRVDDARTLTNFTVNIGIEKRAIEISPDKARAKIENLNKTIKEWEDTSKKLGSVVTGLKGACFATSAVLTFKNFASGLTGETLARQQVMNGEKGWKQRCADMVARGEKGYTTLDMCFGGEAANIDAEVAAQTTALNKVNAKIQEVQNVHVKNAGGLSNIFGNYADSDAIRKDLATYAREEYGNVPINVSGLRKGWDGFDGKVGTLLSQENVDKKIVTTDMIREIMLNAELKKNGVGGEHLQNIDSTLVNLADRINENRIIKNDIEAAAGDEKKGYPKLISIDSPDRSTKVLPVNSINSNVQQETGFDTTQVTHVARIRVGAGSKELSNKIIERFPAGVYTLGLKGDTSKGIYNVVSIKQESGDKKLWTGKNVSDFTDAYKIGSIQASDRVSLNNEIVSADRVCRFYETEPYRGMPAILPFDYREGWYAATRQTLPVFGGIGAFDASGRVTSFWLCNVGRNQRIEFETGFGDDLCQQVNLNTGQSLGDFPGLSSSEAQQKINSAIRAIEDAARQYPNKFITINGQRCEVGKPAVNQPATQCQDFMSPGDCKLLFNVCDPVICPSSRCNFGGEYPVANVAQTGIVGSTLLCLPNIREGIVIPVCLTGIKAGIDGWVSIMRNYRDCLSENLKTGQTVGICDQIHSIYICEFFWGQVAPFVNVLIPKLIETAYGQGVRGGGEYLTVQSAWQNMENSINYFTQSYAVNSLTAFQTRSQGQYGNYLTSTSSIAEFGTELCRNFISAKAPKAFESLIEADSPPQFHAWFDEKTFTTATIPATSQYKVFYHIFAGNDAGVTFQVYLKSPPQSSYYATNPYVVVDSGFIARGEYASQTRDFTAPTGYKELCVRVNNQEECGFGQVTTSFAIDYLKDAYIKEQLTKTNIITEQDCVSGSPSPGALLTPNIQAGVENVVSPNIYNQGVVRVCATENPGKGTNSQRYVNVGYCGNPKVSCWLDSTSVDKALSANAVGLKNQTLSELKDRTQEFLETSGEVFNEGEAINKLDELERKVLAVGRGVDKVGEWKILLNEADFILEKLFFNSHKARGYLLRGQVNDGIASSLKLGADSSLQNVAGVSGDSGSGIVGSGVIDSKKCELRNARWEFGAGSELASEIDEGQTAFMVVDTTSDCVSTEVSFEVFDDDWFLDDSVSKRKTAFASGDGRAFASWTVERVGDTLTEPKFFFVATDVNGKKVNSGKLAVRRSVAVEDTEETPSVPEEPVKKTYEIKSFEFLSSEDRVLSQNENVAIGDVLELHVVHDCDFVSLSFNYAGGVNDLGKISNNEYYSGVLPTDKIGRYIARLRCLDNGGVPKGDVKSASVNVVENV